MTPAARRVSTVSPRARRVGTGTGATLAIAAVAVTATGTTADAAQYTVRSGDTVSHIAARTSTTVAAIARANHLTDPGRILVGQVLTVPTQRSSSATKAATKTSATKTTGHATTTYTVRSGDTVSAIAKKHGSTTAKIVAANRLSSRALIFVGQKLTIPGTGAFTASSPSVHAASSTTATKKTTSSSRSATYTVRSGDTVSAIAKKHGSTTAKIVAANHLNSHALIFVGQKLTIPGANGATSTTKPAVASKPTTSTSKPSSTATTHLTYTVRSGDTVGAIAKRYGSTVAKIVAANHLDARALIRVGQKLTVPGANASTAAAGASGSSAQLVGDTFAGRTYGSDVVGAANLNKATLLASNVPSRAAMQAKIASTARRMGLDPALAQAIAYQESGFNMTAVSPANAIGCMQVIPSSGEWASQLVGRSLNLLDPDDNVVAGVAILRALVKGAPDLPSAIAGYYQGASSVKKNGMFADTRRYVANVQTLMTRFS